MDFLLFTLTLGSFLIILPSPSEGQGTVDIQIPQYSSISSAVKVNCSFQTNIALVKMVLENGNQEFTTTYNIGTGIYIMQPTPGVTMVPHLDTGMKSGHFTFAFSRLTCSDFTWYRCKAENAAGKMESANKTLEVAPILDSVRLNSQSILSVNELSIFTCIATIAKEGSYTLKWFKGSTSRNNEITGGQIKRDTSNECSRTIIGELLYNVTLSDVPTLILWCQISVGQVVQKMGNFTIPEPITTPGPRDPEPVKAGLDPGSIVGIVLGVTATIVLVVLLVWFLVIRPKRLKAEASESKTPEPYTKDYQVQDNVLYATVDPLKKQKHKSSSSSLVDGPDTNSNSVQDTGMASKKQKSNKKSAFLPSSGDATDNMDDAYELPPPPPPPPGTMPKSHQSPQIEPADPLHYAELELAVHKSAKRRSKYAPKSNTEYADIALS